MRLLFVSILLAPTLTFAAEVKEQSISHLILGMGPEYSTTDSPDFVALQGLVNPFYYNYKGLNSAPGCVMKTGEIAFGSSQTSSLRIGVRANAQVYWRGSTSEFLRNRTFVLRLEAQVKDRLVTAERELLISALPYRQQLDGSSYIASTNNQWVWFSFNPFELDGEMTSGHLYLCNISAEQNLYISEIEVELSHRLRE